MANNRMFLVHKPSKLGVGLGKRMSWGWYNAPEKDELERFYAYLGNVTIIDKLSQDDFVIAMEDCANSSCFGDWNYTREKENGFHKFEYTTGGTS